MKNVVAMLFGFVLLATACASRADNPENFVVKSAVDKASFELSKQRGKIVVLHFLLKTECPICLRYTHDYAALAEKDPDVVHVFLKPDSERDISTWAGKIRKDDLTDAPTIYRDPEARLAKAFGIPDGYKFHGQTVHYPALLLLDGDGKEFFRYVGKSNSDRLSVDEFAVKLAELRKKTGAKSDK